jgi:hypothetical protein
MTMVDEFASQEHLWPSPHSVNLQDARETYCTYRHPVTVALCHDTEISCQTQPNLIDFMEADLVRAFRCSAGRGMMRRDFGNKPVQCANGGIARLMKIPIAWLYRGRPRPNKHFSHVLRLLATLVSRRAGDSGR